MTELQSAATAQIVNDSPLRHVRIEVVDSIDQAMEFKRWLGQRRRVLGVDTETGGFSPERDRLRLVQFGDLQTGWVVPWERWGGVVAETLTTYDGPLVMHNRPFDIRFLAKNVPEWSPPWHKIGDTMTEAHLVDPTRPKGLKALGARLVDAHAASGERMLHKAMTENRWTWDTVPINFPWYEMYAGLDPVITCHVHEHTRPVIERRGYQRALDLELTAQRVVSDMMVRGIMIDLEYCHTKSRELRNWVARAREWIKREYGVDNATSNRQVIARLQRDGVEFTKRTQSGKDWALDKEVLEALSSHPLARYVLAIRKAEKICSAYLENFEEMIGPDGRLHANINSLGAITGRMSITNPGLQTLQRDDPTVRTAFVPSPENALVTCDADQIEARLATHFSGDQGLAVAFGAEQDFFCEIASQIFGEPITKRDKRRQITKNTVYGKIYGAGAATIGRTAHVTSQVAEAFIQAFDARFPGIAQLMQTVTAEAESRLRAEGRAYVRTPLGREIPVQGEREYALVNYLIQGHAAEVMKKGLADLVAAGVAEYLVLPVHDEVILDAPAGEAEEIARTVERTLTDVNTYSVPLTWSAEVWQSDWGAKYRAKLN